MKHVTVPCVTARSQYIGVKTVTFFFILLALLCWCTSALVAGGQGEGEHRLCMAFRRRWPLHAQAAPYMSLVKGHVRDGYAASLAFL